MVNEIFVIGGSSLFELALNKYANYCKLVILTRINKDFECDVFMPKMDDEVFTNMYTSKTFCEKEIGFDFSFYGNKALLQNNP